MVRVPWALVVRDAFVANVASSTCFVEAVRQLLEDTFYRVFTFFYFPAVSFNCSFGVVALSCCVDFEQMFAQKHIF